MATEQQKSDLLDALTDAQIASGTTAAEFAAYIGALAGAAKVSDLEASDVGAIVSVGGITTKISAANARIETLQDELDAAVSEKQAEITAVNEQKAQLQAQLKTVVGSA